MAVGISHQADPGISDARSAVCVTEYVDFSVGALANRINVGHPKARARAYDIPCFALVLRNGGHEFRVTREKPDQISTGNIFHDDLFGVVPNSAQAAIHEGQRGAFRIGGGRGCGYCYAKAEQCQQAGSEG